MSVEISTIGGWKVRYLYFPDIYWVFVCTVSCVQIAGDSELLSRYYIDLAKKRRQAAKRAQVVEFPLSSEKLDLLHGAAICRASIVRNAA